jgi:hypothetical protein
MDEQQLAAMLPWLFLCFSAALCVYFCRWSLFGMLGLDNYRNERTGGPGDLDPDGKGPVYANLYRQLTELGFEPFGVLQEYVRGHTTSPDLIFIRPQEQCMAVVWKFASGDPRVKFKTYFCEGVIVLTCNYRCPLKDAAGLLVTSVPSTFLAPVLEEHRKHVAEAVAEGYRVLDCNTADAVTDLQRAFFYHRAVRRQYIGALRDILVGELTLIGIVTCLTMWLSPWPFPANVALGLFGGCLVMFVWILLGEWVVNRLLTSEQRRAARNQEVV